VREHACSGSGVVGGTGVDDPVRGRWSQRHGVVGGSEGVGVLASSQRGPWWRGRGPHRLERRWCWVSRWWAIRWRAVGNWHGQKSRRRSWRARGTGSLTRPHGDGVGPRVVE
jgi:hypothetical protein